MSRCWCPHGSRSRGLPLVVVHESVAAEQDGPRGRRTRTARGAAAVPAKNHPAGPAPPPARRGRLPHRREWVDPDAHADVGVEALLQGAGRTSPAAEAPSSSSSRTVAVARTIAPSGLLLVGLHPLGVQISSTPALVAVLTRVLDAQPHPVPHFARLLVRLLRHLQHLDPHGIVDVHGIFHRLDFIAGQLRAVDQSPGAERGELNEGPVRFDAGDGAALDGGGGGSVRLLALALAVGSPSSSPSSSSAVATVAAAASSSARGVSVGIAVVIAHCWQRFPALNRLEPRWR